MGMSTAGQPGGRPASRVRVCMCLHAHVVGLLGGTHMSPSGCKGVPSAKHVAVDAVSLFAFFLFYAFVAWVYTLIARKVDKDDGGRSHFNFIFTQQCHCRC